MFVWAHLNLFLNHEKETTSYLRVFEIQGKISST